MNCLQNLPKSAPLNFVHKNSSSNYSSISRSSAPFMGRSLKSHSRRPPVLNLGMVRADRRGILSMNASSSSSSAEKGSVEVQVKSDVYSNNMTEAMGAVLTYRHELGMNYNFIRPDLIVGSCLQTQSDVDKLRKIGVKTIFCLQQDSDLEYFDVDIRAIQEYAKVCKDVEHIRAEIRDFDAFDLRTRLPAVVSILHKAINRNGGVTYIHCTAGLGRAPATALAYMFWVQGYKLSEAHKLLQTKRPCFPKLDAIKNATADIGILWHMAACVISFCFGGVILVNGKPLNLTGLSKNRVQLMWNGGNFSSVEVSGLDIGWGQRIPLRFDEEQGSWILERDLPDGRYEYKYVVDGEWTCNKHELITEPNSDGHVNNYVQVHSDADTKELQKRLTGEEVDLTKEERKKIREFLDAYNE